MPSEPEIVERPAVPTVGIRAQIAEDGIAAVADSLPGELFAWLGRRGIAPAGAPFFRYYRVDMETGIDLEWGVPVAAPIEGDGRVVAGSLPAGRYARLLHVGPFSGLRAATGDLLDWISARGEEPDVSEDEVIGAHIENYLTDPRREPHSAKWETEILMRLAD